MKSAVKAPHAGSIGAAEPAGDGMRAGEAKPFAGMPRLKPLRDHVEALGPGRKSVKAVRAHVAQLYEHQDVAALARIAVREDDAPFINEQDAIGVARMAGRGVGLLLKQFGPEWLDGQAALASGKARDYLFERAETARRHR